MDLNDDLAKNQRFLREIEQAIRLSNNEVIHNRIPPITSERMLTFAVAVAKMRAQYIEAAFKFADANLSDAPDGTTEIDELGELRGRFEEGRDAFIALQRAIELGYVDVESDT
jgi:hypothetical protein